MSGNVAMYDMSTGELLVVCPNTGEILRVYENVDFDESKHKGIPVEGSIDTFQGLMEWCLVNGYKQSQDLQYDRRGLDGVLFGEERHAFLTLVAQIEYINYVFTSNKELQREWEVDSRTVNRRLNRWQNKGLLNWLPTKGRGIKIIFNPKIAVRIERNRVPERVNAYNSLRGNQTKVVVRSVDCSHLLDKSNAKPDHIPEEFQGFEYVKDHSEKAVELDVFDYSGGSVSGFNRLSAVMKMNGAQMELFIDGVLTFSEKGTLQKA